MADFMNTAGIAGVSPNYLNQLMGYGASPSQPNELFGFGMGSDIGTQPLVNSAVSGMPSAASPTVMQGMTGYKDPTTGAQVGGWGSMALGAAQGLGSMYMGMKQYGMAKQQLSFQKDVFNRNYAAQKANTNNTITSTNVARAASREGAGSSPYKPLELVA